MLAPIKRNTEVPLCVSLAFSDLLRVRQMVIFFPFLSFKNWIRSIILLDRSGGVFVVSVYNTVSSALDTCKVRAAFAAQYIYMLVACVELA